MTPSSPAVAGNGNQRFEDLHEQVQGLSRHERKHQVREALLRHRVGALERAVQRIERATSFRRLLGVVASSIGLIVTVLAGAYYLVRIAVFVTSHH